MAIFTSPFNASMTAAEFAAPNNRGVKLGTVAEDKNGYSYVFALAGSAVTQYDAVTIGSGFVAQSVTTTLAPIAGFAGVSQVAITCGDYGWIMRNGVGSIRVAASCAISVPLFTTATAGVLDDATTTGVIELIGIVASATGTGGGTTTVAAVIAWPAFYTRIT